LAILAIFHTITLNNPGNNNNKQFTDYSLKIFFQLHMTGVLPEVTVYSWAQSGLNRENFRNEKKHTERCKHCVLAVVKRSQKYSPRRRPLPGMQDRQNLISWRWSLPSPTDPVWWRSMHAISSY